MSKCNICYHKKICIDSANYKAAESCKHYVPAADVQEVKHGYWIDIGAEKGYFCGIDEAKDNDFCSYGERKRW